MSLLRGFPEPVQHALSTELGDHARPRRDPLLRREVSCEAIEVNSLLRGRELDREGVQQASQALLAPSDIVRRLASTFGEHGTATCASGLMRRHGLLQNRDRRPALPACVVQPPPMPGTGDLIGEAPATPKIRTRVLGQALGAILNKAGRAAARPATPRADQEQTIILKRGVLHHARPAGLRARPNRRQCSVRETAEALTGGQREPMHRRLSDIAIDVGVARLERVERESPRGRTSCDRCTPKPTAEQLIWETLRPLRPHRRPAHRSKRLHRYSGRPAAVCLGPGHRQHGG
jgi:hypothetical protein